MVYPESSMVTMVATLGLHPQVVTLGMDLLHRQEKIQVARLVVIHTSPLREDAARGLDYQSTGSSLERLRVEFGLPNQDPVPSRGIPCRYRNRECEYGEVEILQHPPDGGRVPVSAIRTEDEAGAAFNTIYKCLVDEIHRGRAVHLNLSGGYNIMSAYGAVCGTILFDRDDRAWYVLSSDDFRNAGAMHLPLDWDRTDDFSLRQCRLVRVPLLTLSQLDWSPARLLRTTNPYDAIIRGGLISSLSTAERRRSDFFRMLTDREQEVVSRICMGEKKGSIAISLSLEVETIQRYLSNVYAKLRDFKAEDLGEDHARFSQQRIDDLLTFFGDFFMFRDR